MPAAISRRFDLQLQGFETFLQMMKQDGFRKVFRTKLRLTNKRLAQLGAARLSQEIRTGGFEPNSPLTAWLKKSTRPLLDHGDLAGSVAGRVGTSVYSFCVGVTRRTPSGKNLAHMLETGFTIRVTPKMRKLFFYWAHKSGGKFKGLRQSTTAIRVKPRPYMRQAFFDDKAFQMKVQMDWRDAIHATFKHFANKARSERPR